jgi:predicted dehydrogenase
MKQILQSLKDGSTKVEEVPVPRAAAGTVLIRTDKTLVSAGTERMLVKFGKSGLISKARQQPDKVKAVLEKAKTDGVAATVDAVRSKLDQPLALGYCNSGRVVEVGAGVTGFEVGDRVVSNGNHAEFVAVPKNLCARIPDNVDAEVASFTVLGAIGLQGVRLARPTMGECFVVIGLGLIGLITVQLLRAQGCRVLGVDFDEAKLALARDFGAETVNPARGEDAMAAAEVLSRGRGVDGVLIAASTDSYEPVQQAARMCRKRGRIVLIGVTGLSLSRADFYEKELTFQVSCSYGPGRYDPAYEQGGQDYPLPFVRWTAQRNFEAVLDLMSSGDLKMNPLISHRFPLDEAEKALGLLTAEEPSLGIIIDFPASHGNETSLDRNVALADSPNHSGTGTVAFLGAGNYAGRILIPAFKAAGAELHTVVSGGGVSAVHFGRKFGFANAASDSSGVWQDSTIDTVVIATRHDAHANQVKTALQSQKHVFCEKPLCLTLDELSEIKESAKAAPDRLLMLGFNRRFAPHVVRVKEMLDRLDQPKTFMMTVNAGEIPANHWTQDPAVGGGRIIGEACHFVDLLRHLAGAPIVGHHAVSIGEHPSIAVQNDKVIITLQFADGSTGVIHYLANGHKAVEKERLEVFSAGRTIQLNNFLTLRAHGWPGVKTKRLLRQDKGQVACAKAFLKAVRDGGPSPIPLEELIEVSRVTIEIDESLR